MRVVVDVNVIISAMLSRDGAPARVVRVWLDGQFDLIVSPLLLAELERALAYPKLRRRIPVEQAQSMVAWLRQGATNVPDPATPPPTHSIDPGDDFLIALAAAEGAFLVSGDDHLLRLGSTLPVHSPSAFLALIAT